MNEKSCSTASSQEEEGWEYRLIHTSLNFCFGNLREYSYVNTAYPQLLFKPLTSSTRLQAGKAMLRKE